MPGFSDYTAENVLAYITGKTAMPATPTAYVALFTAAPADDGTGGTEVSGTGYARVVTSGASWNSPSPSGGTEPGATPASISNALAIAFAASGASWGDVIGVGLFDALTSGHMQIFDYLGAYPWRPATMSLASPGVITSPAHGYSNGDPVVVTTKYGGNLPTFSQSNLTGVLTVAGATTDTFTVTNGATAVNTSSAGEFSVRKILKQTVPAGVAVSFAAGAPGQLVIAAA